MTKISLEGYAAAGPAHNRLVHGVDIRALNDRDVTALGLSIDPGYGAKGWIAERRRAIIGYGMFLAEVDVEQGPAQGYIGVLSAQARPWWFGRLVVEGIRVIGEEHPIIDTWCDRRVPNAEKLLHWLGFREINERFLWQGAMIGRTWRWRRETAPPRLFPKFADM